MEDDKLLVAVLLNLFIGFLEEKKIGYFLMQLLGGEQYYFFFSIL
jgi:hypothetical protein